MFDSKNRKIGPKTFGELFVLQLFFDLAGF